MDESTDDEVATASLSDDEISTSCPPNDRHDGGPRERNVGAGNCDGLHDMTTICPFAVVTWTGSDGKIHFLGQQHSAGQRPPSPSASALSCATGFEMHVEADSHAALFKIRVPLATQGRRNKTNVFVYIYPEQIHDLDLTTAASNEQSRCGCTLARELLNDDVYCLHFALKQVPALIVPKDEDLTATVKGKASQIAFNLLRSLVCCTSFAVHIPVTSLSRTQLLHLCQAASTSALRTLGRVAILASLYGGKGGKVVLAPVYAHEADDPPTYHETVALEKGVSNKRQRVSSSPSAYAETSSDIDGKQRSPVEVEQRLIFCLAAKMDEISQKLTEHMDDGFNQLKHRLDGLEDRLGSLEHQLDQYVCHVGARIDRQEDASRVDFERQLEDLRDELELQIEDRSFEARDDIKQYVQEEVLPDVEEHVRQGILEQLRTALNDD